MDIFSWSVPFVSEKILEMLVMILKNKPGAKEEAKEDENLPELSTVAPAAKASKKQILRNRVKFVGKMAIMMKTLREERENLVMLKGFAPDKKIPRGLL